MMYLKFVNTFLRTLSATIIPFDNFLLFSGTNLLVSPFFRPFFIFGYSLFWVELVSFDVTNRTIS